MKGLKYMMMLALVCVLASCVKEVEFSGEESDPRLVVNGIEQVGQPARLQVEKSLFFMDTEKDCRVKDVEVDLFVNGVFKESLQVRDSLIVEKYIDWNGGNEVEMERLEYAFNYCEGQYLLCAGDRLRFEVRSSEFDMAIAEVTLPQAPQVMGFDVVNVVVDTISYDENVIWFELKLDDPRGPNYYNLDPREGLSGFTSTDPVFSDLMGLEVENLIGESSEYYGYGPYNIFSDTYFEGKVYTVSLKKSIWSWDGEPFVLEVSCVDENLYRYQTTYDAYVASDPESILGMFTEPVQVYSNIQNGLGVVAAQSQPIVFEIDLSPDY